MAGVLTTGARRGLAEALIAAGADAPAPDERRSDWVRVRVRMGGTYRPLYPEGGRWFAYSTIDVSAGGAALECAGGPLEVGDVLLVRFDAWSLSSTSTRCSCAPLCGTSGRTGRSTASSGRD